MSVALVGCSLGWEPTFEPTDAELFYLSRRAAPARALELCLAITDGDLRPQCQFTTLRWGLGQETLRGAELEERQTLCLAIEPSVWRDECLHSIVQLYGRELSDEARICEDAGTLRDSCLYHQMTHIWSARFEGSESFGRERELFEELLDRTETPIPVFFHAMSARLKQRGDHPEPLTSAHCGVVSQAFCAQVFAVVTLDWVEHQWGPGRELAARSRIVEACAQSVRRTADIALPWADDVDRVGEQAWDMICDQASGDSSVHSQAVGLIQTIEEPFEVVPVPPP